MRTFTLDMYFCWGPLCLVLLTVKLMGQYRVKGVLNLCDKREQLQNFLKFISLFTLTTIMELLKIKLVVLWTVCCLSATTLRMS